MSELIVYGGAFNPPTIGHFKIIEYLVNKFPNKKIIVLPTNNFYKSKEIVSYEHRKNMLQLMCRDLLDKIEISDYEQTLDKYMGTYYTLEYFNHPYFVIGADSLEKLRKWINYPNVVIDNKYIVFPRGDIDIQEVINNNDVLSKNKENFIICDDFIENNISSTDYRENKNESIISENVLKYIKENSLYK